MVELEARGSGQGVPLAGQQRPLRALFAGLLEGPLADRAELERAVAALQSVAPFRCSLDVEAGRFSLLVADGDVPGERLDPGPRAELLERLDAVVQASAPARVESTLRCTLYFEEEVVEILFSVADGALTDMARRRALTDDDRRTLAELAASDPSSLASETPGRGGWIAALVALTVAVVVWQSGVISALRGTPSDALALDTGRFRATLTLEVGSEPLKYVVRVSRGAEFPETANEIALLSEALPDTADRLAMSALGSGERIWARLVDSEERTLATAALDLRPLVLDRDAVVSTSFAAAHDAAEIRLDLLPGGSR